MIWELKYRGNLVVAKICGEVIYEFLLNKEKNVEKIILIPIPLSTQRRRERGFNQNELVINAILKLDKESNNNYFECDFISLIKSRHTVPQSKTKSRKERLVNVQNCFEAVDNSKIMGREVILIDDVVTTGTTVKEAMKVLKSAGVKSVKCVALAHG
jgi:competence protein ComFC